MKTYHTIASCLAIWVAFEMGQATYKLYDLGEVSAWAALGTILVAVVAGVMASWSAIRVHFPRIVAPVRGPRVTRYSTYR